MAETHDVRVLVREVPYKKWEEDAAGNDVLLERIGFGPGHFRIEPGTVLPADADPESEEYKQAYEDYQFGQVISLLDDDYARLTAAGAVIDVGSEPPANDPSYEPPEDEADPQDATVEELRAWIENEKPNVNTVVQASGGDPETARKLLEAESLAHNGEPRKGVFDGLSAVIGRG